MSATRKIRENDLTYLYINFKVCVSSILVDLIICNLFLKSCCVSHLSFHWIFTVKTNTSTSRNFLHNQVHIVYNQVSLI